MNTIVIKTQAELDSLPDSFKEYTVIQVRSNPNTVVTTTRSRDSSRVEARGSSQVVALDSSQVVALDSSRVEAWDSSRVEALDSSRVEARGSSRVEARGSSRVEARDSSRVEAWDSSQVVARGSSQVVARDSSRVEAWDSSQVVARGSSRVEARGSSQVVARGSSQVVAFNYATVVVLSSSVLLAHLADRVVCRLRGVNVKPHRVDDTVVMLSEPAKLDISFETWLERGYVVADGISAKLISKKKKGQLEIFTVEGDFLTQKKAYVVKRGDQFSHGDTVKGAIEDLRYKISSRDTSRFKEWKPDTKISVEDAIQAYRAITGACEFGVKRFVEGIKIPKALTVGKAIEMTRGVFGNSEFERFFK